MNNAINIIKKYEKFEMRKYKCPRGIDTIGYGHVILPHERLNKINEKEAERLLEIDLQKAKAAVNRNIKVALNTHQYEALLSFTFNVGGAALQRSSLRQKINREEHEQVMGELLRWVYAGGRVMRGLVARRMEEGRLYCA